jgi:gluconolactonase
MQRSILLFAALLFFIPMAPGADDYRLGPDSQVKEGIPQGKIIAKQFKTSKIFPGTERDYWIYVPSAYDATKPACLMVFQDGGGYQNKEGAWRVPVVFDNLIHAKEMPVTIGVFINPGVVPAAQPGALPRFNRSFEYDGMGDDYARFLLEELLPEVEKEFAISKDPNDRAIGGASSGAICAFTVAWERPDSFRRVFSTIGTYVGLRGGNEYPTLVRKMEPKPLRVFLQDGSGDLNIYGGDWFNANQGMLTALTFSGYEVTHVWGDGGHNSKHGASLLPDALRWLWKDWPAPVTTHPEASSQPAKDFLIEGEDWQLVGEGYQFTEGPASDAKGNLYFADVPQGKIYRLDKDGKPEVFVENSGGASGLMFGPDGWLYGCAGREGVVRAWNPADGVKKDVATEIAGNDLCVSSSGHIYVTEPKTKKIWLVKPDGSKVVVDEGIEFPNGLLLSPDQSLLYVADARGRFVWSFQVKADGTLQHKQAYYHLHVVDGSNSSKADGMTVDEKGRLYVATEFGVQVCDQAGRVNAILRNPHQGPLANVCFGGPERDVLYATIGDKVYRRKLATKGVFSFEAPVTPEKPRL